MYNAKIVLPILLVFLGILTYPIWSAKAPTHDHTAHAKPKGVKCVESTEYMRANHMKLLDEWRHSVVRDQERTHVSKDGRKFEKSLTNTCLDCHDKKESCDSCHAYTNVEPYCFSCHLDSKDPASKAKAIIAPEMKNPHDEVPHDH